MEPAEDPDHDAIAALAHEGEGVLRSSADAGEKAIAHHGVSAMQADLYVLLCELERRGRFGSGELFYIAQHYDSAVVLGKIEDGLFKKPSELGDRGVLLGVGELSGMSDSASLIASSPS